MSRIWAYEKPVNPNEIEEVTSHDKADILLSQFEESERSPDTGKHPGNGSGGGSDGGEVDDSNDNSVYYQYEGTGESSDPNANTPDETIDPIAPDPREHVDMDHGDPPVDMNPNEIQKVDMNPNEIRKVDMNPNEIQNTDDEFH